MNWLERKSELQKLKKRYSMLMKQSYEIALRDKEASDRLNREATEILEAIKLYQAKEGLL